MNTKYAIISVRTIVTALLLSVLSYGSLCAQQFIDGGGTNAMYPGGVNKADKLYKEFAYHEAIPLYEAYLKKHPDSTRQMLQLADCYRLTSKYDKALQWYESAAQKGGSFEPKYKLYYAQMLQMKGRYEDAAKWYAQYNQEVPEDRRSAAELKACSDYGQYLLTRVRYTVKNLPFNTSGYDFSPALFDGGLIYASSRDSSKAISREHTWTGTQFFDMWYVKGDKADFGKPQFMKGDATTKYHEGTLAFTDNNKKVFFTRNNFINKKTTTSSDDKIIKLAIYESDVEGKTWKNDKPFQYNNPEYSVGHPAITPDGKTMYFVSDMPGGFGATDIYVTQCEGEGWSTPKNLGPQINTEGREMFPTIVDSSGYLYFSSDAHGGLGGLDIFKVKQNAAGEWVKMKNIGAPINSSYDDYGFIYGNDRSYGYFTSDRQDGRGLDDIYTFVDEGIDLEGIVVDAQTGEPICTSTVIMQTKKDRTDQGRAITECDGEFEFSVVKNTDYCFTATADGYFPNDSVCASTVGVSPGGKVFVKIPLQKKRDYALNVTVLGKHASDSGLVPLPNATIQLTSVCEGWTKTYTTNERGQICEMLRCDCNYIVVANAKDYLPGMINVEQDNSFCLVDRVCGKNPREVQVVLERISGAPVELKDIYYDFDKWNIRSESEKELYKLLGFLQANPDAIVEIASHTDARAPYDYNIKLSQRRAQSVVDWLLSRGIDKKRLVRKGYGETKPRNNCTDNVECTEFEHQRNRRTEFSVIGGSINLKSLERFDMEVDPCKSCPF
ncbi:MAG TPA: OmpA family protein [Chitinophagales bacterium]|nr:OmpA family protein [Chitinophagales bacterium]